MFNIFRSKLQNRFILFFIVLGTVPVFVLGGTALYLIDLSHKRDVSNLELQVIDQKEQEIRKFFSDTLGIIELRVGFTQTSEIDPSQQEFLLAGILDENRAFEEVSLMNLNGFETAKKSRRGNESPLQNVSGLTQFIAARKGGNFIGEVHQTISGPIVTIAAPIRNRNDEIIQIISAQLNLSSLVRSVETARLGSSGYLILLDTKGSVIAPQ
ncbi:MAG: cache domain-containing protein, partial [Candidatus Sungbacteria bacterium]|nr:cache domain-containing protein [Candidatus Sungbacteria bacterium]